MISIGKVATWCGKHLKSGVQEQEVKDMCMSSKEVQNLLSKALTDITTDLQELQGKQFVLATVMFTKLTYRKLTF
ncbi:hypothetical protein D3C76_1544420 [compost metagenome]